MSFAPILAGSGATLAAAAGLAAYGGLSDESKVFGSTLVGPPEPTQLALTFDDGPNPAMTPRLLEILARHNARATFFLIGAYVQREPALTRAIFTAGHTIGNHTMHHLWLPRHSASTIRQELRACNQVLEDTIGAPVTLFRAPHGARRPAVYRAARELGLGVTQWNLMVGDWKPRTAADLHQRIARGIAANRKRQRGTCLVLHDGGQHSAAADRTATIDAVASILTSLPRDMRIVIPPQWT